MAKNSELPPGYVIPIHRSLTQEIYWAGVPRNLLLLEVFGSILGAVIFKTWIIPVIMFIVHICARWMGQKDSKFISVYTRSLPYKDFYKA